VWRLTANQIAFSGGMILGGLLISKWSGFKNKILTMATATLLIGGSTLALGMIPEFISYLVFMAIIGLAMPFFNVPSTVLLQEKVEADMLGRVFGVLVMISTSMMPLGMLVFGPLADKIVIEWLLIGTCLFTIVAGFFLIKSKVLTKAGKPFLNEPVK